MKKIALVILAATMLSGCYVDPSISIQYDMTYSRDSYRYGHHPAYLYHYGHHNHRRCHYGC